VSASNVKSSLNAKENHRVCSVVSILWKGRRAMADVKWIKITTDVFDDEKILLIESLPEADSIIVIWFKLLCLAGKQNNSGVFLMGDKIAYTDKMLATIFRRKESTVQLALQTFEQFGMIELIDGVITIPNWGKHQSLDQMENRKEFMRNYMREYRAKQKALTCKDNCKPNNKPNVRQADKEEDKEEDKDKDIILLSDSDEPEKPTKKKSVKHKYGEYKNVLLTDDELQKLKTEYSDYEERIERLSSYVASTGKSYKSHYATIRNWARKDAEKPGRKEIVPSWMKKPGFNDFMKSDYDMDELERELLGEKKTTGSDPELKSRADALKERLGTK
jgi:predicted phage replisome organizer